MTEWKKVEALLFATGRYLTEEQICNMTDIPKNKIKAAIKDLEKHYSEIDTSLKIFFEEGMWKMNPKEDYSDIVKKVVSEAELPRPIMETLAVIAYKNPVLQSEVIDIRGSGAYEHISLLEDKGFVIKEKYGRTYKLKLAEKFFDYFDVEGEKDIRKLFKDIKKPEPKVGNLEVYNSDEKDTEFSKKITERMKKIESSPTEEKEKDIFLNGFEEKLSKAKNRIDETEKELSSLNRSEDTATEIEKTADVLEEVNDEINDILKNDEQDSSDNEETKSETGDEPEQKATDDSQEDTSESTAEENEDKKKEDN